MNDCWEYSAK